VAGLPDVSSLCSFAKMASKHEDEASPSFLAEIRAAADALALPFTEAEIGKIAGAVTSLRVSAARVRLGLQLKDEPAFEFKHPPAPEHGQ
jgi:hypothetical protein